MRALVVEAGGTRSALAAVRALRAAGWTVGVGAPSRRDGVATRSRAVSAVHAVPPPGRGFAERVAALVREHGYDVVFGAGDAEVLALGSAAGSIGAALPQPPYDVLVRALDKLELTKAAAAAGFPVPEVLPPGELRGRGIVKPRWHWLPSGGGSDRFEAVVVDGPAEAEAAAARIRAAGREPVAQPYVAGPLTAYCCVFDGGVVRARVQQRATRIWPASAGVSVRAETVPVDPGVEARATALLADLGWRGLAEIQFVGGRLVDLNGRVYGSLALALAAGVNLPAVAAALATGRTPPPAPEPAPGVRYQWFEGDLRASGPWAALRYAPGAVDGVWRLDDPLPGLASAVALARRAARKALR